MSMQMGFSFWPQLRIEPIRRGKSEGARSADVAYTPRSRETSRTNTGLVSGFRVELAWLEKHMVSRYFKDYSTFDPSINAI